jgi:hypothetical protein
MKRIAAICHPSNRKRATTRGTEEIILAALGEFFYSGYCVVLSFSVKEF